MFRFYSLGCGLGSTDTNKFLESQPPFRCLRLQHTMFLFLQQIHRVVFSPHEFSYSGGLIAFFSDFSTFGSSFSEGLRYLMLSHSFSLMDSCVSSKGFSSGLPPQTQLSSPCKLPTEKIWEILMVSIWRLFFQQTLSECVYVTPLTH